MTDSFVTNNSESSHPRGNPAGETSLSLLDRAKTNDQEAWARLVNLYSGAIYVRCRSKWKLPAADAQLISQDVFTIIAKKLTDFNRQRTGSFRSWVRTITDNHCKDIIKKLKREKPIGGTDAIRLMEQLPDPATIENDTKTEAECQVGESVLIMRQAVATIQSSFSERDWGIFWQTVVKGRKGKSVAEELEVSDNVVYLVCSRIKKRIKAEFDNLIDDEMLGDDDERKSE